MKRKNEGSFYQNYSVAVDNRSIFSNMPTYMIEFSPIAR